MTARPVASSGGGDLEECTKCGKVHKTWRGDPSCRAHRRHVRPLEPCRADPLPGSAVCSDHGGLSPRGVAHPNFRHGRDCRTRFSGDAPPALAAKADEFRVRGDLLNLQDHVAMSDAALSRFYARLRRGEGEDGAAWKRAADLVGALRAAHAAGDEGAVSALLEKLGAVLAAGAADADTWAEIREEMRTGARLRDTHARIERAGRDYVTRPELELIVAQITSLYRETGREGLREVGRRVAEHSGMDPGDPDVERIVAEVWGAVMVTELSRKLGVVVPAAGDPVN